MQVKYWIVYAFLSLTMVLQAQQSAVMEWEEGTAPLDGIVEETNIGQKRVLPYPPIREADILWQKRVWRVLDTREKMNLPFRNPQMPFFTILTNEIENGVFRPTVRRMMHSLNRSTQAICDHCCIR
jgi:hypothetical protein